MYKDWRDQVSVVDAAEKGEIGRQKWEFLKIGWFRYIDLTLHAGSLYHLETNPSIFRANQWSSFYMIGISVMKELMDEYLSTFYITENNTIIFQTIREG